VLQECFNAPWRTFVFIQPSGIPFSYALAFLNEVVPRFRFIDPLSLTNQYQRRLCTGRFGGQRLCRFVLCERDEVVIRAIQGLSTALRMKPDAVFENIDVK
jgi:hypothetical protein